jgi:hypothetical protein
MLEVAIVVVIIVCATTLVGYLFKLAFMSKCASCDCLGMHIKRNTEHEAQTASNMQLPIHK